MMLEVCGDGLWTLSSGLTRFHGHGSWLGCEVAHSRMDLKSLGILKSDLVLKKLLYNKLQQHTWHGMGVTI